MLRLLCGLTWFSTLLSVALATYDEFSIPGLTQTLRGYDTELGTDPICWFSSALLDGNASQGFPLPSGKIVEDFVLADEIRVLTGCPSGTWVQAQAPPEFALPDVKPRTLEWYNYTVQGSLDIRNLAGDVFTSDKGRKVVVGIVACDAVTAGFCTPFVHEQANIRAERERIERGEADAPTMSIAVGDRHGGTHVHAPAVILDIPDDATDVFEFETEVPMLVNDPGFSYLIGTLQFFTTSDSLPEKIQYRYDVANAIEGDQFVVYKEPPTILELSSGVKLASYIVVGACSIVLLGFLWQIFKYRNHQVLRLGQVHFLMVFLLSALVAVIGTFFLNPRNDIWCQLSQPIILIPLQLFYSISLGRLWRIHSVVSPLLRTRLQSKRNLKLIPSLMDRFFPCLRSGQQNFRREVSANAVTKVVVAGLLPQLVLQIVKFILQPDEKLIEFNEEQSIGRCVCGDSLSEGKSLANYGIIILLLLIAILLGMAHLSRELPSLLNESSVIYETTLWSAVLLLLGSGVVIVTDAPTTSPDAFYIVYGVLVVSSTMNCVVRILLPKLRMVWSNQEILVSRLVQDHRQARNPPTVSNGSTTHNVSGLEKPMSQEPSNFSTKITSSQGKGYPSMSSTGEDLERPWPHPTGIEGHTEEPSTSHNSPEQSKEQSAKGEKLKTGDSGAIILIKKGRPPPRKLVLEMIDLQQQLDLVNERIMSGLNVDQEDWETIKKLNRRLENLFARTEFEASSSELGLSPGV